MEERLKQMEIGDVTTVIIAQNEEAMIGDAVLSALQIGRVLVVDGGSSDHTVQIAERLGATVLRHRYEGFSAQYNFGLSQVRTKWAFILDADERISDALAEEVRNLQAPLGVSAYDVNRLNYFLGAAIRHSGWRPDRNARLLLVNSAWYEDRPVHARVEVHGERRQLRSDILHLTDRSVDQYLYKLTRYTTLEVSARREKQESLDSRSALRSVYLRLPAKPIVRFIYMYLLRLGFLDGRRGLDLAVLSSFYEYVVEMKARYEGVEDSTSKPEPRAEMG